MKFLMAICYKDVERDLIQKVSAHAFGVTSHMAKGNKHKFNLFDYLNLENNRRTLVTAIVNDADVEPLFGALRETESVVAWTIKIDAHAGAKSFQKISEILNKGEDK